MDIKEMKNKAFPFFLELHYVKDLYAMIYET